MNIKTNIKMRINELQAQEILRVLPTEMLPCKVAFLERRYSNFIIIFANHVTYASDEESFTHSNLTEVDPELFIRTNGSCVEVPVCEPQIVDTFIKHDSQKPNLAILLDMPQALAEIARVLEYGAAKYDHKNWAKCDDPERYIAAALRHISAYHNGEKIDPESGYSHLAHAVCSLLFLEEIA